jgi:methylenetetrahydrofolate dehydrogenase (NADP+)/methenyltetrahydrofolate cyclohydrolase
MAIRMDGKALAQSLKADLAAQVNQLVSAPGLATVLIGEDPASQSYIRSKLRLCEELGMRSQHYALPADVSQIEVESLLQKLAQDPLVDGILVQLPLPRHLDEAYLVSLIPYSKDVDGFHPTNMGLLAMKGRQPAFVPCTPAGCMRLLEHYQVPLRGARALVLGRSNIVGMPMALLLTEADATVSLAHSRTSPADLEQLLAQSDIVVVALGRPQFLKGHQIKPGCCLIDVGINRTPEGLVGDVDFASAEPVAGWITPVPGGVGPMTLIMLMQNTLRAAQARS